jgi:acyl phosphate:glycerol-3-phosphate acyltransferase
MPIIYTLFVSLLAYLIGSIPFGLIIVRLSTGKDIRRVESGRTGGTNAMRAAGFWAGLTTVFLDFLKGACTVWLARALLPGNVWAEVISPVAAVLGHNYSLFLMERDEHGHIHLRGGAGGATAVGGAFGLWPPSLLIILPLGALIFYGLGYASVTTMSAALLATIIFGYRAWIGHNPWEYALYGLMTEALLIVALLPNIQRLIHGTERVVGWRAHRKRS